MNTKKRILIIAGAIILGIFSFLMVAPYLFKDKIVSAAKKEVAVMLNAKVDFNDFSVSFFKNFPKFSLSVHDFRISGVDEFSKDTLINCKDFDIVVNLSSIFGDSGYEVNKIILNEPRIYAHVLPNGKVNWDIMKKDTTKKAETDTTSSNFKVKLQKIEIKNANIVYNDEQGKMRAVIGNLNHTLSGDLASDQTTLDTYTSIDSLSFYMDKIPYLSKANVELKANIDANLKDSKYTLKDNYTRINAIKFAVNGWVQMLKSGGYDMDLKLDTKEVDFKSILSLIPAIYAKEFNGVKASGNVNLSGFVKGKMEGENYPAFSLKMKVSNGTFQYPDLPKSVQGITINASVESPGGSLDKTIVDVSPFAFSLGGNPFSLKLHVVTPMSDPDFTFNAVGKLNLGMVKDFYPLDKGTNLNGLLDMNLNAGGKLSYYDKNQYENFRFSGKMTVSKMVAKTPEIKQQIDIDNANLVFNNRYMDLTSLKVKIGKNDISATGKIENYVAYALHDKTLKGSLNIESNYLNLNDFMTESSTANTTSSEPMTVIEIPKNIDFTMQALFKQLVYEKMNFSNAKGALTASEGDLKFNNLGLSAFGGNVVLNGIYSTKDIKKPTVNMNLALNNVVFTELFKQVETIKKVAPIFEKAVGNFSTKFSINTTLKKDMMPDLATLAGSGSLSTSSVGIANSPVLGALASTLKNPNLNPMKIKDLALMFDIKDGKVNTKPFNVNIGDIKMNLGGATGLDESIAYNGKITVPEKYKLGNFSNLAFKIGGTFTKPKIQLDVANTLNNIISDTKTKALDEAKKQVDNAKAKALDEANKKRDQALKAAQEQADKLRNDAKAASDKILNEAQAESDKLVAKASNPLTKAAAQIAAKKVMDEARKKADGLNKTAETQAQKILDQAASKSEINIK